MLKKEKNFPPAVLRIADSLSITGQYFHDEIGLHMAPIGARIEWTGWLRGTQAAGACSVMSPFSDLVFEQVTP